MRIVRDLTHCPHDAKGAVIVLGNFDGIHIGHQSIIRSAKRLANDLGVPCAVMTFFPHPLKVLRPDITLYSITSFAEKAKKLKNLGVDVLYALPFTHNFSQLSADHFIHHVLVQQLNVAHVVIGHNFIFGSKRSGNASTLLSASDVHGYGFTQCNAVCSADVDAPVSSTYVRSALLDGNVTYAATLLGHPITLSGKVVRGDQRGRVLGFPTANVLVRKSFPLANGVYACRVSIPSLQKEALPAVANVGQRPTFASGPTRLLETFLFDFSENLYDMHIDVELIDYLRPEKTFPSVEALKDAIECDIVSAHSVLEID